jgi:hypothetical protein
LLSWLIKKNLKRLKNSREQQWSTWSGPAGLGITVENQSRGLGVKSIRFWPGWPSMKRGDPEVLSNVSKERNFEEGFRVSRRKNHFFLSID